MSKQEENLIKELRELRKMEPTKCLTIDTTPANVLKLMIKVEKLKLQLKEKND